MAQGLPSVTLQYYSWNSSLAGSPFHCPLLPAGSLPHLLAFGLELQFLSQVYFLNPGFCLGLIPQSVHNDSLPFFMYSWNQMESILQTFSLSWNSKNRHPPQIPLPPSKKCPRALTTFPMFLDSATLADVSGPSPSKQNLSRGSESGQQMRACFRLRREPLRAFSLLFFLGLPSIFSSMLPSLVHLY